MTTDPDIDDPTRDAVGTALGYEIDDAAIRAAVAEHADYTLADLRHKLARLQTKFDAAGGRGVSLADALDRTRVALAARPAHS